MRNSSYFIDVQGTLICDEKREPIEGACEFINELNDSNIPYVVITNNTKAASKSFLEGLRSMGLNIKNYIDPFYILSEKVKDKKVAAFGTDEFLEVLIDMGYILDYKTSNTLIVSIKKDYNNDDYASMIENATRCERLVAMHETSTYSKDGRKYPGVGAIMNMIKFAVNKDYEVVGKPSKSFYEKAKNMINENYENITVISDDMIGDLLGAKELNMKTCLVLSGKIKDENEILNTLDKNLHPNLVCNNMSNVLELLKV